MDPQSIDPGLVQAVERRSSYFWDFLEFVTLPFNVLDIVVTAGRLVWSIGELVVWVVGAVLEGIGALGELFS